MNIQVSAARFGRAQKREAWRHHQGPC